MKPAHFVRMFKPQFSPLVESGEKLQTVRPVPKRMPKVNDTISLRAWTGKPYRSKQRELKRGTIISVDQIWFNGVTIILGDERCAPISWEESELFARADGFKDLREMSDWFEANHGPLPFRGIVIKWKL